MPGAPVARVILTLRYEVVLQCLATTVGIALQTSACSSPTVPTADDTGPTTSSTSTTSAPGDTDHDPSDATSSDGSWPECEPQTHERAGGSALFGASTWPWAEPENDVPAIEHGSCHVLSVDTPREGTIAMDCDHANGTTHRLQFDVDIAADRLDYLLDEEQVELRFQQGSLVFFLPYNHIVLRRLDGSLLLSTASFRCVRVMGDGWPLLPMGPDPTEFDTWHAPFGEFFVRDGFCPDTDDPRPMADNQGGIYVGTERRRAIETTTDVGPLRMFDRTEVHDVTMAGEVFDIIVGDVYVVSEPSDDCYGAAENFTILRADL